MTRQQTPSDCDSRKESLTFCHLNNDTMEEKINILAFEKMLIPLKYIFH